MFRNEAGIELEYSASLTDAPDRSTTPAWVFQMFKDSHIFHYFSPFRLTVKDKIKGTEFDVEMDLRVEIEPHKMDTLTLSRRQSRSVSKRRSLFNTLRPKSTPNIKNRSTSSCNSSTGGEVALPLKQTEMEGGEGVLETAVQESDDSDTGQSNSCATSVRQALVGKLFQHVSVSHYRLF